MLSINIPEHTTPDKYELSEVPAPKIDSPKDILIKTHAASINPIDVKKASGVSKLALKDR
jgi:NADPH:quinone reductase-like Zn-dependent oxidoreductase